MALARATRRSRQLVYSDFNPKNLLAGREDGRWSVIAVLDWGAAFSGGPLHGIGNVPRFGDERPAAFLAGVPAASVTAGARCRRTGPRSARRWTCSPWPTY